MSVETLRPSDIDAFKKIGVSIHTLECAQVQRATHKEARTKYGIQYKSQHLEGIVFPYLNPEDDSAVAYRVRRDNPEQDAEGQPIAKYLSSPDRRHLYFGPDSYSKLADTTATAIIFEAEKSVLSTSDAEVRANRRHGLLIALGGNWGWRGVTGKATSPNGERVDEKGVLPDFDRVVWTDRDVVIAFDSNPNESTLASRRALAAELTGRGAKVRIAELPVEDGVNGPDDYCGRHGAVALFAIIDAAKPAAINTAKAKKEKTEKPTQGRDVQFEQPEPWPEPVSGADMLTAIDATFTKYLALPEHTSTALALWVLHAYTIDASFTSPMLAITSPVKRCGKTLTLILLGALVPRRMFAANVTPAVLFRTIEKYKPTLLIDEADTFVKDNDELRGVLNSGHTRTTAVVIRAVGEDHDPREFSTWCPKAIALIGKLPDTLGDRAIEVSMRRRTAGERVERLRQDRIEGECAVLRRQAARWTADHLQVLRDADPHMPAALHDRAADCWRPLLALADRAGGSWPTVAREAAKALSGVIEDADQPVGVLALADVQAIFDSKGVQEVSSNDLAAALRAMDSRPWATWGRDGKGLNSHALARLLKDFQIHPFKIRFGAETLNGYTRRAFEDAWTRYPLSEVEQANNTNEYGTKPPISEVERAKGCSGSENATLANEYGHGSAVPVQTGEIGQNGSQRRSKPMEVNGALHF